MYCDGTLILVFVFFSAVMGFCFGMECAGSIAETQEGEFIQHYDLCIKGTDRIIKLNNNNWACIDGNWKKL